MQNRMNGVALIATHRIHAFAVPIVGLLLGILIIWRWPKRQVPTEVLVSVMWVLSLVWVGFVLLMWQTQNIPIFHGMRGHY